MSVSSRTSDTKVRLVCEDIPFCLESDPELVRRLLAIIDLVNESHLKIDCFLIFITISVQNSKSFTCNHGYHCHTKVKVRS